MSFRDDDGLPDPFEPDPDPMGLAALGRDLQDAIRGRSAGPHEEFGGDWDFDDSWIDKAKNGRNGRLPDILAATDGSGKCLFYSGLVHTLYGEAGSAKSWASMFACVEQMQDGEYVLWIDTDGMGLETIYDRLCNSLHVPEALARSNFLVSTPEQAATRDSIGKLCDKLLSVGVVPKIIVLDSLDPAMALQSLSSHSNDDLALFMNLVVSPLHRLGSAVILNDHVAKSVAARNGPIGGVRKRNAVSVAIELRVVPGSSFDRHSTGRVQVIVDKDRVGHHGRGLLGQFTLTGHDGPVTWSLDFNTKGKVPVGTDDGLGFRPDGIMIKVDNYVRYNPGVSRNGVIEGVGARKDSTAEALDALVRLGFVDETSELRGQRIDRYYRHIKSFQRNEWLEAGGGPRNDPTPDSEWWVNHPLPTHSPTLPPDPVPTHSPTLPPDPVPTHSPTLPPHSPTSKTKQEQEHEGGSGDPDSPTTTNTLSGDEDFPW